MTFLMVLNKSLGLFFFLLHYLHIHIYCGMEQNMFYQSMGTIEFIQSNIDSIMSISGCIHAIFYK